MDTTPRGILVGRRAVAYAVTFAAFYFAGTMAHMRVWGQFGLFFCGLIAATVLSFMIFLFIATLFPPKAGKWLHALAFATEIAASIVVLKLLIPIVPTFDVFP